MLNWLLNMKIKSFESKEKLKIITNTTPTQKFQMKTDVKSSRRLFYYGFVGDVQTEKANKFSIFIYTSGYLRTLWHTSSQFSTHTHTQNFLRSNIETKNYLLYLEELDSCVVNVTGDAGEGLLISGMHLGTALPCELPWFVLILSAGTEHAGAVRINLKHKSPF